MDHRVRSRGSGCPVHKEAQSGAARLQWEHVGLGCELLLRDGPIAWRSRPGPQPRTRLRRKTSVSQLQDAHEPAVTCGARHPGRVDGCIHELDCAGALRELLQKEIAPPRVQTRPDQERARLR